MNMKSLTALLAIVPSFSLVLADFTMNFMNDCDVPVNVYVNGGPPLLSLAAGESTFNLPQFPGNFSGYIWTDAKGGSADGSKSVKVGINWPNDYYWFKRPQDGSFNVGMTITVIEDNGPGAFCYVQSCYTSETCPYPTRAFQLGDPALPTPSNIAPTPPLFRCKGASEGHNIGFCSKPRVNTVRHLHASTNLNKCLDVRGAVIQNGTPVQIYDCNGSDAQTFQLPSISGTGPIKVGNTNFCVDAGSSPAPGVGLKIWQCYDGLAAQQWTTLPDGTIKLAGKNLCIDLTDGVQTNAKQSQTWTCGGNNPNQIWW